MQGGVGAVCECGSAGGERDAGEGEPETGVGDGFGPQTSGGIGDLRDFAQGIVIMEQISAVRAVVEQALLNNKAWTQLIAGPMATPEAAVNRLRTAPIVFDEKMELLRSGSVQIAEAAGGNIRVSASIWLDPTRVRRAEHILHELGHITNQFRGGLHETLDDSIGQTRMTVEACLPDVFKVNP